MFVICVTISEKYKSDFNKHLKTKKHHVNSQSNDLKIKENTLNIQKHPKTSKNIQKHPKTSIKFICDYCDESFTNFSNKRRHELHRCKNNQDLKNLLKNKNMK